MAEFKLFTSGLVTGGDTIKKIDENGSDRKALVKTLVGYSEDIAKKINQTHEGVLLLQLYDATQNSTDLDGWVLDVNQLFIKEEWGFTKEDPFLSQVARIEITELEINGGLPKINIKEWLEDEETKSDAFGISMSIKPEQVVLYLESILQTGNARLIRL